MRGMMINMKSLKDTILEAANFHIYTITTTEYKGMMGVNVRCHIDNNEDDYDYCWMDDNGELDSYDKKAIKYCLDILERLQSYSSFDPWMDMEINSTYEVYCNGPKDKHFKVIKVK